MNFARLPVGQLFLAFFDLILVLTVQYFTKLWVQEVKLVRHRATALGNLYGLADAEFATLSSSKKPVELLLLHLFSMCTVKEDTCICHATKSNLERFITFLAAVNGSVRIFSGACIVRTLPPVYPTYGLHFRLLRLKVAVMQLSQAATRRLFLGCSVSA